MLPSLKIKDFVLRVPIIQGGMGAGVSMAPLAGAVAKEGGMGVLSSVALDILTSRRVGKQLDTQQATRREIEDAKALANGGVIGINIMVALFRDYADAVKGALDAKVDAIISGAGLPVHLPEIVSSYKSKAKTALIPIVSSGRALDIICKRWKRFGFLPDAVIVEGPLAGGHLGWKDLKDIEKEENKLENLLTDVLETTKNYGNIPVIAAGGIYTHEDIVRILKMGASGVQMGTRFLATEESSATDEFKQAVVNCTKEDIIVAYRPGSPCGMLFRLIKQSPMYQDALQQKRPCLCNLGYVKFKNYCPAMDNNKDYFCICNGLITSTSYFDGSDEKPLFTVGSNAYRVDKILSVKGLMKELVHGKAFN